MTAAMSITTGMHPAIAVAKADLVYDAKDEFVLNDNCFFSATSEYEHADRSVGFAGGWNVTAKLIGAQIEQLVLSAEDAAKALERNVEYLTRCACEAEALRLARNGRAA